MEERFIKEIFDGQLFHVCTNGLEMTTLLRDDEDFRTAWNYLALSAWRIGVEIVAFTLMSNHIHVLFACNDHSHADKAIKLFKKMLSLHLKNRYGIQKALHRTKDCISLIDSVQYLKNCIAYILRNPVCARLCAKPEQYKWSSYSYYFADKYNTIAHTHICNIHYGLKRKRLKTGMNLIGCPLMIDQNEMITLESFVRNDIAEKAYRNSGKSFLYYLGCCNDAQMEYELACQPLMRVSDQDLYEKISTFVIKRFRGKTLPELTTSEKCSVLKSLFFNNRTSVPQLSRIMGLPRELVHHILST